MYIVCVCMCVCVQHAVRDATKEYADLAEIKGCLAIPCKINDYKIVVSLRLNAVSAVDF